MKFAAAAITPGLANIVQYGTEPSAKSIHIGCWRGKPHSRASARPGATATPIAHASRTTRSRLTPRCLAEEAACVLDVGAHEEAGARLPNDDAPEAGGAEQEAQLALRVVEDRAIVDHFVPHLAHRALDPVPAREARDGAAGADLAHPADVLVGGLLVVEVAERHHDVELAVERSRQEVAADELDLVAEALEPLGREVEHLLRQVDVDVLAGARFESELPHARRAAADVEDARLRVLTDDVERELAPPQEPGPDRALERVLLVVQSIKRGRLLAKVISDEPGCVRRSLHTPPRS